MNCCQAPVATGTSRLTAKDMGVAKYVFLSHTAEKFHYPQ